jgi:hypothetical protein
MKFRIGTSDDKEEPYSWPKAVSEIFFWGFFTIGVVSIAYIFLTGKWPW